MSGHIDMPEDKVGEMGGSPSKKHQAAENFLLTKDKILGYANEIIRQIKERLEQMDDPNGSTLEFGVE